MAAHARPATIALIIIAQSTQNLAFSGIALFLPLIRQDIEMTFAQAGSLAVSASVVYTVMQVPSGYLGDRFGAKRLFLIGLLGLNAMSFLLAVLDTYHALVVNQAISGFFRALVFAPGLLLITAQFSTGRRATAMGLYVAGGFSSIIVLNLLGPVLVEPLGWRTLFVIFSAAGVAVVLLYWWVSEPGPAPESGASRPTVGELVRLLRHRIMWLASLVQFVRLAVVQSLRFWLPTYLVTDKGFSLQVAGLVVALGAAVTVPSNFIGGYLSDLRQQPLLIIGTSLSILAASFVLLVTSDSLLVLIAVVALQSVFVQAYFGSLFEVPIQHLGERGAGTVNGFGNFWANVGGLVFTYVLGVTKDVTGSFSFGWYSLAAMCVIGLVATLLMRRVKPLADGTDPTATTASPAP